MEEINLKKYKGFLFIASLALVVVLLAGCSSSNPIAEELAIQRAALIIGSFDDIHTITVNGTEIKPDEDGDWKGLFEVGSDVRIVVDPADGWEFDGWDFNNNANGLETTIVMFDDNTRITPNFSNGETGDVGAEGLQMVMETQPGNSIVGEYIEGPPVVVITNNQGPVEGVEVEVSLDTETMLNGTTVQTTDADGIATFDDLVINTVASGYELVFNAEFVGIPLMVESEPFDVNEPAPVEDLVASIEIEPVDDQEIKAGDILEFTATAYDEDGNPIEDIVNFSWQNADENGVFNNTTAGEYDVRASIGEVSSPVTKVTVKHAEVVEDGDHVVTIDPVGEIKVQAGQDQVFTARAEDKYGNLITEDVNDFVWNGAENGVFNETTLGDYKVSAVYAGVESAKTDVEVIAELEGIDYIELKPDEDQTVQAGEEIQFTATAYDQFDNVITSDASSFTWGNTDVNGLFRKEEADDYVVKASLNNIESNPVNVKVTAIPAESGGDFTITIDPAPTATVEAGVDLDFSVEARDKYDNLITDAVEDFGWTGAIAGVFNETIAKEYEVYATLKGKDSESTTVTVTAQSPENPHEVKISPAPDAEVQAGVDLQFSAEALDQYGNIISNNVTEFDWDGTDNHGLFNETVASQYYVSAKFEEVSSEKTEVTVKPVMDAVNKVEIIPDEDDTIIAGETIQFNAKALDEFDNVITDVASDFTWTNTNENGLFDKTVADEYTVKAEFDGILSNEVKITVVARPADPDEGDHTVTINPAPTANVQAGVDLEFSAIAEDRYGNLITDDVTDFIWDGTDSNGIFNEDLVGSYDVFAEYVGVKSDITKVNVSANPPSITNVKTLLTGGADGDRFAVLTDPNVGAYVKLGVRDDVDTDIRIIVRWLDYTVHEDIGKDEIRFTDNPEGYDEGTVLIEFTGNTIKLSALKGLLENSTLIEVVETFGSNIGGSRIYRLTGRVDGAEITVEASNSILLELTWNETVTATGNEGRYLLNGEEATEVADIKDDGELTEFINVRWLLVEDVTGPLKDGDILDVEAGAVTSEATGETNLAESWQFDGDEWYNKVR